MKIVSRRGRSTNSRFYLRGFIARFRTTTSRVDVFALLFCLICNLNSYRLRTSRLCWLQWTNVAQQERAFGPFGELLLRETRMRQYGRLYTNVIASRAEPCPVSPSTTGILSVQSNKKWRVIRQYSDLATAYSGGSILTEEIEERNVKTLLSPKSFPNLSLILFSP